MNNENKNKENFSFVIPSILAQKLLANFHNEVWIMLYVLKPENNAKAKIENKKYFGADLRKGQIVLIRKIGFS